MIDKYVPDEDEMWIKKGKLVLGKHMTVNELNRLAEENTKLKAGIKAILQEAQENGLRFGSDWLCNALSGVELE